MLDGVTRRRVVHAGTVQRLRDLASAIQDETGARMKL